MKKNSFTMIAVALLVAAATTARISGDVVYVTSKEQGCTDNNVCPGANPDGSYTEFMVLGDTGIKGSAPGRPITPNFSRAYLGGAEVTDPFAGVDLSPVLGEPGGVYRIDYNFNANAANVSLDVVMSVSAFGGTLSFTETDKFQRQFGIPTAWQFMGYLTNDPGSTTPVITFAYQSGLVTATGGHRLIFDAWRFTLVEPCLDTPVVSVTGPVSAASDEVVVTGVVGAATAVTVYQDTGEGMIAIGTKTTDITEGNNVVIVSGLVKGAHVSATQTVNGQEGCTPPAASGPIVGGGANPSVRVAFSIRETSSTGPAGTSGSTASGSLHFLGATTRIGGAPGDGPVLAPSLEWQTVTLQRGTDFTNPIDPSVKWNAAAGSSTAGTPNDLQGEWGVLDAIAFAIDDLTDTGPYEIYIDALQNGTEIFESFEGGDVGTPNYTFWRPRLSGSTSGNLLGAPDESVVTDAAAFDGEKSLRVQFQWSGLGANQWLRLTTAANVPNGIQNPQVNLSEPISIRFLLIPPGTPPAIVSNPEPVEAGAGQTVTLSVSATGSAPLSYQWQFNGEDIDGETGATLVITEFSAAKAGKYRVMVSNAAGTELSAEVDVTLADAGPAPELSIAMYAGITIEGVVGNTYRLEYTEDLNQQIGWQTLATVTLPSSPYLFVDPGSANAPKRYYRAVAE